MRNLEKAQESLSMEIKSLQSRLEREKKNCERLQDQTLKQEVDLGKLKGILNGANKAIKTKDLTIQAKTQEVNRLNAIIQQFSQLKDGK